jgi:outer membrane protein, heavy metal efflux system
MLDTRRAALMQSMKQYRQARSTFACLAAISVLLIVAPAHGQPTDSPLQREFPLRAPPTPGLQTRSEPTGSRSRLTVDEAVQKALQAHPDLASARKAVDVARAGLQRSKAWLPGNPYFSAGAGTTTQAGVGSNYGMYVSQEFEIGGQRSKRIDVATLDVAKATSEMVDVREALVAVVKTAFVDALVSTDLVTLARQSLDITVAVTQHLSIIKHPSDAQRIDINNAQIQESHARRDIAATQQTRDNAMSTIRRLLSLPLDQEIDLIGTPSRQVRTLPSEHDLVERALRQRPDLAAQQRAQDRATAEIALLEREGIPNITVSGNVSSFEGATLTGGDVGLHIPVFQRNTADVSEAIAERERERVDLESLKATVQQEAIEARRACEVAAVDLEALRDVEVPKDEENLQLERRLYEAGDATYTDVLSAQLELLTARRSYLDAVQAYNDALIELERTVGGSLEP